MSTADQEGAGGMLRIWVRDLKLGMRFAATGGREGWTRTVLTAVGVDLEPRSRITGRCRARPQHRCAHRPHCRGPAVEGHRGERRFKTIRRGLLIGATVTLALIGASLLVSTLEQLRERRRLLAVLVAFGTRRSVLGLSVLWQTAVPVVLGLTVAVVGGLGLGAALLKMVHTPFYIEWASVGTMSGVGGAVILVVTALTMPALWRMMRPDGATAPVQSAQPCELTSRKASWRSKRQRQEPVRTVGQPNSQSFTPRMLART